MKNLFAILILAAMVAAACSSSEKSALIPVTTSSDSALALYKKALKEFDAVRFVTGTKYLREAIEQDPGFFMANYYLAVINVGNKERFDKYASAATGTTAKLSQPEELIRGTLAKLGADQHADVTDVGRKLIEMYPGDMNSYWFMYFFQNIISDHAGSAETLANALKTASNPAPIYNMLGYTYMNLNKDSAACAAFDKYIALEPANANVYDSKGDYFLKIKDYPNAFEHFRKAFTMDSANFGKTKMLRAKFLADSTSALATK